MAMADWDGLDADQRRARLQAIDAADLVKVREEYVRLRRAWHDAPYGPARGRIIRRMYDLFIAGYELAWKWHELPDNPAQAVRDDILQFGLRLYQERAEALRAADRADQVGPDEDRG